MTSNYLDNEYHVLSYVGDTNETDSVGIYAASMTPLSDITSNSVILTLPGAFTPTCTNFHVPSFEDAYDKIKSYGIDNIFILTSNDFFTQRVWLDAMRVTKLKAISDFELTFGNLFINTIYRPFIGVRNRRELIVFKDGNVKKRFSENYLLFNDDPYEETTVEKLIAYLDQRAI
jgi:peroxiredoxin